MNIALVDKMVVLGEMYFRELITISWENTGIRNSKKFKVMLAPFIWRKDVPGKRSYKMSKTLG